MWAAVDRRSSAWLLGRFIKVKGSAVYVGGELYKLHVWPVAAKYSLTGKRLYAWTPASHVSTVDDMTVDARGRVVIMTFQTSLGGGQTTTAWSTCSRPTVLS